MVLQWKVISNWASEEPLGSLTQDFDGILNPKMVRLRERLIHGAFLNLIAVAFNQGSTLIGNIVVARILMKQTFGEYAMVQSTLLTIAAMAQLATGYTASKYLAEYRAVDSARAGRIMGLCAGVSFLMAALGTILLVAISPWLSSSMLKAPHLATPLMIGAGFLFFSTVNGYQTGALSGLEAFRSLAKAGSISGIGVVAAVSLGAWLGGLPGALTGLSVSALFRCAVHQRWLRLETRLQGIVLRYRGMALEKAVIVKFALPASLAGYYALPMIWLGNSFLVRQAGGYGEMALYTAAMNIKSVVLFLPAIVNGVVSSILNQMKGTGDQRYSHLYRFNVILVFSATLVASIILGILADPVLGLFGRGFPAAKTVLWVVLTSGVFEATATALYQRIQNYGRMWLSLLFINLPLGPVFVILAFYLTPELGALGLGIANAVMTTLSLLITGWLAHYMNRHERPVIP
jgi:O-antigen/teichoic acid export membrane protein